MNSVSCRTGPKIVEVRYELVKLLAKQFWLYFRIIPLDYVTILRLVEITQLESLLIKG